MSHIFNDGTTNLPPELGDESVDMNYIGSTLRILGLILSGIIIFLSLLFMGWTFVHQDKRVVNASQPIFLVIVCLGTLLMGASIIPMSLDDEVVSPEGKSTACMAVPWLFALGFGVTFSALFAKTMRVNKLFNGTIRKRCR